MFLDDSPRPIHALLAHIGEYAFTYLSVVLHAVLLAALYYWGSYRIEADRQQRSVESGQQLTERARLEKRVHDMARIKSMLEQSADAGESGKALPEQADVQFSAQPRAPDELLKDASELSRAIANIERDIKAQELARLLDIPKEKALEQLAEPRTPEESANAAPEDVAEAAARIEQLESRSREVLEQRRQQLEQQQNGIAVTAGESSNRGNMSRAQPGQAGSNSATAPAADIGPGGLGGIGGPVQGKGSGVQLSSALGRMNEFSNPDMPEEVTKAYTEWGAHDFFDRGVGRIPVVDPRTLIKGAGRLIGPGGAYATRIYVNRWYLIGPFEGKHGEELFSNHRHPPEQGVVLDAAYRGKDGQLLKWEYINMARYPLSLATPAEDAVYYGYTELMIDEAQDLIIWVGADDDAQLWINDKLVWTGGKANKRWFFGQAYDKWSSNVQAYNLTEGKRIVHFNKGRNKLFFKLSNGPTRLFFSLVLTKSANGA